MRINETRLISNLQELGTIGSLPGGGVCRPALSEEDRLARDWLKSYLERLGLQLKIDQAGNMFGILPGTKSLDPVVIGSHLDTVFTGGLYDGSLGILAGLEVIESFIENGIQPDRPVYLANFTNEEGVRFAPDMMGSLAFSGQLSISDTWNSRSFQDDMTVKQALMDINYLGENEIGFFDPYVFLELHIEQGPVLEREKIEIGIVESLQGIFWTQFEIIGRAAHAGTTPLSMRKDAMLAFSKVVSRVQEIAIQNSGVGTVGYVETYPNAINIVAEKIRFSTDLRNQDMESLKVMQQAVDEYVMAFEKQGFSISKEELVRLAPVEFDKNMVKVLEEEAKTMGLSFKKMVSGAGHDAQMMSSICPTTMIFVPSVNGISHNIEEKTHDMDVINGTKLLGSAVERLSKL